MMRNRHAIAVSLRAMAAVLVLLAGFAAACKTTPPINWDARVGTYTYNQAVTDLGPPDRQAKLTDGKNVCKWVTARTTGPSFGVGTGFYGPGMGVGVGQTIGPSVNDHILTLTFDTNNMLSAWSKNY